MYFDFKVSKSLVWSAWEIRLAGASRPIERVNADKTDVVLFIYCSDVVKLHLLLSRLFIYIFSKLVYHKMTYIRRF